MKVLFLTLSIECAVFIKLKKKLEIKKKMFDLVLNTGSTIFYYNLITRSFI